MQEKCHILEQNLEKAQDIIDEASIKDVEVSNAHILRFLMMS